MIEDLYALGIKWAIYLGLGAGLVYVLDELWPLKYRKPKWFRFLHEKSMSLIEIPKYLIRILIIHPSKGVEEFAKSMITHLKKMESRVYLAYAGVFFLAYKAMDLAAEITDPQTLYGLGAVYTPLAALMMYVTKRLIDSRDKDHERGDHLDPPEE